MSTNGDTPSISDIGNKVMTDKALTSNNGNVKMVLIISTP